MDFAAAWDALAIGDQVEVSDGTPPPPDPDGVLFKMWRSHNFTGQLVEKIDGDYRGMKIELPPAAGVTIAYTVAEAVPHTFTAV